MGSLFVVGDLITFREFDQRHPGAYLTCKQMARPGVAQIVLGQF